MKREDLSIVVNRLLVSYQYKNDPKNNSFENNWKNNSIDSLQLVQVNTGKPLFHCNLQTISNHPGYRLEDTVAAGNFDLKCFVEPRNFYGQIHAITNTIDIEGQAIRGDAMQTDPAFPGFQNGRWLLHSRYSPKTGRDTNSAWSGGCFIPSTKDLTEFNELLKKLGINTGDVIPGVLVEV